MSAAQRTAIGRGIDSLDAGDPGTALYDSIDAAVGSIRDTWDPGAINAVIVLTDGRNEVRGGLNLDRLIEQIRSTEHPVRVFTIAYGSTADEQAPVDSKKNRDGQTVLERISGVTGAVRYDAKDPTSLQDVLIAVLSNF